ncbi:MAG: B12-binding domain-containing radical SAM protein [Zoogloeaceae bacterium]|nr:B12-binding domain-containing radical SAM protein [Zoogloeaceae bacterium]
MSDVSLFNFFLHRPRAKKPYACIPMGVLYLSAALEEAGYAVDLHDYQVDAAGNPYAPEAVSAFFGQARSDLVGISCMANMLPFLVLGLRRFKRERPGVFVVLGGAGPSGLANEILERVLEVDAVVSGEGEEALVEIVEARRGLRAWDSIRGLVWRKGGAVFRNPPRPRRRDIESLPWPAYHLIEHKHYIGYPILTARGCPYRCTFCDISPNADHRVSTRSIDDVLDEIDMLQRRFGAKDITILDDTFVLSRPRVVEFCSRLRERGMQFTWASMCRADRLDDELMDLMASAGCQRIFLGIESGSERVREIAGKGLRITNVDAMIDKTTRRFDVAASFILGFPFESMDEFRETLWLSIYCLSKGAHPQMCVLSPLPQAELTRSGQYRTTFSRDVISGMAFPRHSEKSERFLLEALSPEIEDMILGDPKIFSAFYHFADGQVREKLELARKYGLMA